jgi:hypothetical protein
MKRMLMLATVALVMAATVVVSAFPAFGAANEHASCQGAVHSRQVPPGAAGVYHSKYHGQSSRTYATFGSKGQLRHTDGRLFPDFEFCEIEE